MSQELPKSTDIDFHLSVETTPGGGALIHASWRVLVPDTTFNVSVEAITVKNVRSSVGFMSDLQRRIVDDIRSWGASVGTPTAP